MQTLAAKSGQYRHMGREVVLAKGFGFGQVADKACWRI
jgi:hypothetical protein